MIYDYEKVEIWGNGTTGRFIDEDGNSWSGAVIMESTGFKDKNGKEIYEGDVVNTEWKGINIVKFGEYSAEVTEYYASDAYGFYFETVNSPKETDTLDSSVEVIGNLYENPELIN